MFVFIPILIIISFFLIDLFSNKNYFKSIKEKNNKIIIKIGIDGKCKINKKWIDSKNKECIFDYVNYVDKLYIKDKYNSQYEYKIDKDFSKVNNIKIKQSKMYLAIDGSEKIDIDLDIKGKIKEKIQYTSDNEEIATISNEGIISGINNGNTTITAKLRDKKSTIDVTVTNLITPRPEEYNFNKEYLSCNMFSKEENDLLDEILEFRTENVGYKTRASVVEAARFITLEFPYRIAYFSENGRLHPYGATSVVDGEGRFYHKGLYLNSSRYEIINPKMHGPGTWGCQIYSNPSEGYRANGFDCSGFISWIILNGGYDSEDVGAGVSSYKDLTDLGTKINLNESIENNKIRAGDLLSGKGYDGGHIALIAGIKDSQYYVAESLWYGTGYFGSLIRKYDINELKNNFYWHIDMNNFYINDGNYTEYWK